MPVKNKFVSFQISLLLSLIINSCGPDSNILAFLTPQEQQEVFDAQLAIARLYYDQGELDKALTHAQTAFALNPFSEIAASVLGYTYLGLAGLTPLGLIEGLNQEDGKKEDAAEESAPSPTEEAEGGEEQADKGTNDTLGEVGDVVGITPEEFALLGSLNKDDPELPVVEPVCAGMARTKVVRLGLVNEAIGVICSFVDPAILIATDGRHQCESTTGKRKKKTMSHFLWALTHLVEALAFHSVVTYSTTDSGKTNLEMRVDKIQSFDVADISLLETFIARLENLTTLIDKVMPISGQCSPEYKDSQLTALVTDLVSVSAAFSSIPGIPPEISASIVAAVEQIKKAQDSAAGASQEQQKAAAVKADFTKQMSTVVAAKIAEADPESITPEQRESVCQSYSGISGGQIEGASLPDLCKDQ